jgi:hypothetical protein
MEERMEHTIAGVLILIVAAFAISAWHELIDNLEADEQKERPDRWETLHQMNLGPMFLRWWQLTDGQVFMHSEHREKVRPRDRHYRQCASLGLDCGFDPRPCDCGVDDG